MVIKVSAAKDTHLEQTCRVGRASPYSPRRAGDAAVRFGGGFDGILRWAPGSFAGVIYRFSARWGRVRRSVGQTRQQGRAVSSGRVCPGTRSILLQLFSRNKFRSTSTQNDEERRQSLVSDQSRSRNDACRYRFASSACRFSSGMPALFSAALVGLKKAKVDGFSFIGSHGLA